MWSNQFAPDLLGAYREIGVLVERKDMLAVLYNCYCDHFPDLAGCSLDTLKGWYNYYPEDFVLYFHDSGMCEYSSGSYAKKIAGNSDYRHIYWCKCVLPLPGSSQENVEVGDLL